MKSIDAAKGIAADMSDRRGQHDGGEATAHKKRRTADMSDRRGQLYGGEANALPKRPLADMSD